MIRRFGPIRCWIHPLFELLDLMLKFFFRPLKLFRVVLLQIAVFRDTILQTLFELFLHLFQLIILTLSFVMKSTWVSFREKLQGGYTKDSEFFIKSFFLLSM